MYIFFFLFQFVGRGSSRSTFSSSWICIDVPTNIGIARRAHALSAATLVVVSDVGVDDVSVAPRVFASLICHLRGVSTPGAGVRIARKKKPLWSNPSLKFTLEISVGISFSRLNKRDPFSPLLLERCNQLVCAVWLADESQ